MSAPDPDPEGQLPPCLGRPLVALATDVAAAGARPPCRLATWANLLRLLDDGDVPQRELRARSRLSRRVLTPQVEALTRHGWLTVAGAARAKTLALTPAGRSVAEAWRPVPPAVEARWRADLGPAHVDRLRAALAALVTRLPLELPHYPATYGTVDATIAGGFGADQHGADWSPVPRADGAAAGAAVAALPLHALLSQALVAFALDYEAEARVAFIVAATVLRHVGDGGTPLTALPGAGAVPYACRYALGRHGLGTIGAPPGTRAEVVRLTARGRAVRDAHPATVETVTVAWRAAYGAGTVAELAAATGALAPDLPPGLPDMPLDA